MNLVAVTICINYADYLECIVRNREHFDHWVIMTVGEDHATHEVCAKYGLDCRQSALLRPDGSDFHAAYNKGPVLNEGLNLLAHEDSGNILDWAIILDSDVLLPRDFGRRIRALPLEVGCLYAMGGRKICDTRESFEMLRECEPWDRLVARNSQALGFFNLFSFRVEPNRYPQRGSQDRLAHDDHLFAESFPEEARRILPMTCLHTGPKAQNWAGRSSANYRARNGSVNSERGTLCTPLGAAHNAAVVGYYPGGRWLDIARDCSNVFLVDHYGIFARTGEPLLAADRAVLQAELRKQSSALRNLIFLPACSLRSLSEIPDGSLDLLYLSGEVTPEWLSLAFPYWQQKLKAGAWIRGDFYGLPHWPDATYALALLLGTPDQTQPDGSWAKRYFPPEKYVSLGEFTTYDRANHFDDGLIFLITEGSRFEALTISLHAARTHWRGRIQVFHCGPLNESLRLICARYSVQLCHLSLQPGRWAGFTEDMCAASPFRRTLLLEAGDILVSCPTFEPMPAFPEPTLSDGCPLVVLAWPDVAKLPDQHSSGSERMPGLPDHAIGLSADVSVACHVHADRFTGEESAPILACNGEPSRWTESAWEKWCEVESEAALFNAARIRVASDATIVSIVASQEIGDFQRNWLTWHFDKGTPILLVLVDVDPTEVWLPQTSQTPDVVQITAKQAEDTGQLLRMIHQRCRTGRVIFLPPTAAALPGAELWHGINWESTSVARHFPGNALQELSITGNRFIPSAFLAMLSIGELEKLAGLVEHPRWGHQELMMLLHEVYSSKLGGEHMANTDLAQIGWRFPNNNFFLHGENHCGPAMAGHTISKRSGLLQLADDVVVISLPERTDRRKEMTAMMKREGVWFRFVDGVRVTDAEIDPNEVADVGHSSFKQVAGIEKYLRGMVGCRRAHLGVLNAAYEKRIRSLLIIEDDMRFQDGWLQTLKSALTELPENWLQLYFSALDFQSSRVISPHLRQLAGAYQTTAILYSETGIIAARNCLQHSRSEIDHWMGCHLHPYGNSYSVEPRITYQKGGISDIMSVDRGITA
jgi:hypothetical protein